MNADEASRCLDISRSKLASATCASDLDSALKFAKKAAKLSSSLAQEVAELAREISERRAKGFAASSSHPGE
jgi:hypothetical protein